MASRRLRRTKSFSSYLAALNQDIQDIKTTTYNPLGAANLSIGSDALDSSLILNNKSIESGSYIEGISGWKIDGSGVAEFSDVFVRGDINAYSGTIGYWNISSPDVFRRIGNKDLYGTFVESTDIGPNDYNKDSGTYVGLYKSYIDVPVAIVSIDRTENVATAISTGHRFKVGDFISVDIPSDSTLSTGKSTAEVIEVGYNYFRYINFGEDVPEVTGADYAGTAELNNKDVSGLYLQDYGKALFDYGYFSNEGVAYVSAETPNLVYNASFEETPAELGIFTKSFTDDSWLSYLTIESYEYSVTDVYNGDSTYGGKISWDGTAYETYLHAKVNESDLVRLDFYKNDRELYLNFDMFFVQEFFNKVDIPTTNSFYTTSSTVLTIVCPGHGLAVDDLVYLDFSVSATGYNNYTNNYRIHTVLSVDGDNFTIENKFGTTTSNPVTLSRRFTTSGPVIFKYIQPILDLEDIKISIVTDNSDPFNQVLDSTTSLKDILTDVTLANWDDYRYWSHSAAEFENWYFYSDLLSASALYRPISSMGVTDLGLLGGDGSTKEVLNVKISSAKLEKVYRQLSPVDSYNSDLEFYLSFPEWLWEGTESDGSTAPTKREVKAVSPAGAGYILDNVSLSPSKKFFYGDSGPSSFYYKLEAGDIVKTDKVSYEAPRKWLDIDLDFQTAELKYIDSVEFKSNDFLRQLYINPGINSVKSSATVFGDNERLLIGESSTLNISSGQYKYLTSDGLTYRSVEAYSRQETGVSSAVYRIHANSSVLNPQNFDGLSGAGFGVGVDSHDKGEIAGWADEVRLTASDRIIFSSVDTLGNSANLWIDSEYIEMYSSGSGLSLNFLGNGLFVRPLYSSTDIFGITSNTSTPLIIAPAAFNNELVSDYQTLYISNTDSSIGYVSSSIVTKKNIEPLSLNAANILEVEPVQFNYKSEEDGSAKHAGFIAEQLVEAGLAGYVSFGSDGKPLTINYEKFVSALQLVARYQAEQITELQARVSWLEAK